MNFNEYQHEALKTADYPDKGRNILYPAMGMSGESGECLDKIKKYWRNFGITSGEQLDDEQRHLIALEISDVIWYCSALAKEIGLSLDFIAELNLKKLADRKQRNVIKSEGDLR
jgi:NTP pyrophosphatase (non-canonical NTP hydrolase)